MFDDIGSLGDDNTEAYVSDITVDGAKLTGTTNGVRIKTWQGGSGNATNISFKNIKMKNVTNPIIIDQQYCDQDKPCKEESSAVEIKDVTYQSITGTSANEEAITFDCSKGHPCQGIVVQDIDISMEGDGEAKANCTNAEGVLGAYNGAILHREASPPFLACLEQGFLFPFDLKVPSAMSPSFNRWLSKAKG
nr:putative polygalacturonase [Tanacetum cinerariifolium]